MEDEEFSFGPFSIRPVKMDHSAYDSYGFIITDGADESIVFHTGDFRAHGLYGDEFWDTISSLPDADAVVCEATNIERSRDEAEPEWKIEKQFKELFKQNKYNSVFVSSTNIDRIFGIYRAAAEAGRIVLMDEYQYDILNSVIGKNDWMRNETERFEFIDEDGSEVSDTYDLGYEFDKGLPFVLKLDRTVKKTPRFYIPAKLRKLINWKGCVLIARPTTQFESLIESFPAHQSKKYLSQWKGYLNPDSPAYNEGLAKSLGAGYDYVHTSGHADVDTLGTLLNHLNAAKIIPIHTENPKKFMETFYPHWPVLLLNDGESYIITDDY